MHAHAPPQEPGMTIAMFQSAQSASMVLEQIEQAVRTHSQLEIEINDPLRSSIYLLHLTGVTLQQQENPLTYRGEVVAPGLVRKGIIQIPCAEQRDLPASILIPGEIMIEKRS